MSMVKFCCQLVSFSVVYHLYERGPCQLFCSMTDHRVSHFMAQNHLWGSKYISDCSGKKSFSCCKIYSCRFSLLAGRRFCRSQAFPRRQRCFHLEGRKHSWSAVMGSIKQGHLGMCENSCVKLSPNEHCTMHS